MGTSTESPKKPRKWRIITVLIVIALTVAGFLVYSGGQTASTSSSCTEVTFVGSPPFCLGIWHMTFYAIVNYSGSWIVSYQVSNTGLKNVSGTYGGTGYNYTTLSFEVYGLSQGRACLTATKQDSSNRTLFFSMGSWEGNTSLPFGSVRPNCFSEVYA